MSEYSAFDYMPIAIMFLVGAGFGVSQSLIPYAETDSYTRVFFVGLLNTLLVAGIGIIFATIIGFVVGVGRLSPNWLKASIVDL